MELALVVLSLIGIAVLLRVLVALVRELLSPERPGFKMYVAKYSPPRSRGALIHMHGNVAVRKSLRGSGALKALALLLIAGITIRVRGQEIASGPQGSRSDDLTSAAHEQVSNAELLAELAAMKRRIEQLEGQLKARDARDVAASSSTASAVTVNAGTLGAAAAPVTISSEAQEASAPVKPAKAEPFAFADWTWLNGNPRTKEVPFDSKFFTPEVRVDVAYHYDFNHPKDDTISGSSEVFRSNEVSLTHLGVGGDFHYDHVRARVLSQIGLYSTATPRNDASYSRGQWQLDNAYRYVNEAYGGYHFDAMHGINVDAGIFLSYVGLFSFYNFDNWAYQPSYVSSNTPWFFTGLRAQMFPTEKLKIEPWFINGWQSYGRYNSRPGFGGQVLYRPRGWLQLLSNNYGAGADVLGVPNRTRYHSDNSIEVKYYDHPERFLDKMAFSLTGDIGCESGGGVNCTTNKKNAAGQIVAYKQSFLGFMLYNRWWFNKDRYGFTLGGGKINNPGRYLVLLPPINGATATSGTPYFTENPGDPFKAWDMSATYDYMPSQYITFRWEFNHRHANVPYWSGPGGVTPPGGNTGTPGSFVTGWQPDLRHTEDRGTMGILVKF